MNNKVLVTGAMSSIGRPLIKLLKQKGESIKAATRHPTEYPRTSEVEAVKFDFDKPETFRPALEGTNRVVLMPRGMDTTPETTGIPFIDEAIKMGIKHIVLISGIGVEEITDKWGGYYLLEKYVINSGIPYTILRGNWFMSMFSKCFIKKDRKNKITLPAGEIKLGFIDPYDIAEVTVMAFIKAKHQGKIYELTGGEILNIQECAVIISQSIGYKIQYTAIKMDEYRKISKMSPDQIEYMVCLYQGVRDGWYSNVSPDVTTILGRKPTTFKQYLEKNTL